MKNQIITATTRGFAMPSCAAPFFDAAAKVRDAHVGAGVAVRHCGSPSWKRLRST